MKKIRTPKFGCIDFNCSHFGTSCLQLEVQMQLLHFLQQVNLTTSKSIDLTSNDDIS